MKLGPLSCGSRAHGNCLDNPQLRGSSAHTYGLLNEYVQPNQAGLGNFSKQTTSIDGNVHVPR